MSAAAGQGALVETLDVGVVSPFVWSTFLKQATDAGLYAEFNHTVEAALIAKCTTRRQKTSVKKSCVRARANRDEISAEKQAALQSQIVETV